jgi:hypothetical protein
MSSYPLHSLKNKTQTQSRSETLVYEEVWMDGFFDVHGLQ